MLDIEKIKTQLNESISCQHLEIKTDNNHFMIIIVSNMFNDLKTVKRQQMVYQPLMSFIQDGSMHAVSIKTFTPKEWEKQKLFF